MRRRLLMTILFAAGCPSSAESPRVDTFVRSLDGGTASQLRIEVRDEHDAPTVARVSLSATQALAPPGSFPRIEGFNNPFDSNNWVERTTYFYVDGAASLEVPSHTDLTIEVRRGLEYRKESVRHQVPAGSLRVVTVHLRRWIDQAAAGWYSGDTHVHLHYGKRYRPQVTVDDAAQMMRGEDLNVLNLLVANSQTREIFDEDLFSPNPVQVAPRHLYRFGAEFRSTLGHTIHLGIRTPPAAYFAGPLPSPTPTPQPYQTPLNADIAQATRAQGGAVVFAHPLYGPPGDRDRNEVYPRQGAQELPVAAALGAIDSVDVLHLTSDEASSVALWYRLLNVGLELAASGGTDAELDEQFFSTAGSPIGTNRVYVKVAGAFDYAAWIAGLRAHRTFCTNGPMLELIVDGRDVGERFDKQAAAGGTTPVRVRARARARFPIGELKIVVNGRVTAVARAASLASTEIAFDADVALSRSSWIAARVDEQPGSAEVTDTRVFAHTSPVWVTLDGAPIRSPEDARFLIDYWIDPFYRLLDELPDASYPSRAEKDAALARVRAAKAYYEERL